MYSPKEQQQQQQQQQQQPTAQQQNDEDIDEEREREEERNRQLLARFNQPVVSVPNLLRRVGNHIELVTRGETSAETLRRQLQFCQRNNRLLGSAASGGGRSASAQAALSTSRKNIEKKSTSSKKEKNGAEKDDDEEEEPTAKDSTNNNDTKKSGDVDVFAAETSRVKEVHAMSPLQGKAKNELAVTNFMKSLAGERGKKSGLMVSGVNQDDHLREDQRPDKAGKMMIQPPTRSENTIKSSAQNNSGNIDNGGGDSIKNSNTNNNNNSAASGNAQTIMLLQRIKMNDDMINFLEAQTAFEFEIVGSTAENNSNNNKEASAGGGDNNSGNVRKAGASNDNDGGENGSKSRRTITDKKIRREVIKQAIFHLQKTHPELAKLATVASSPTSSNDIATEGNKPSDLTPEQLQDLKKQFRKAVQYSIKDYITARRSQQLDTLFQTLGRITRPDGYYKMHTPIGDGAFGQTHLVEWVAAESENEKNKKEGGDSEPESPGGTKKEEDDDGKAKNKKKDDDDEDEDEEDDPEKKERRELKKLRLSIASNPAGAVSYLSCSRQFIPGADGTRIPRERAFVCKMETRSNATRRAGIVGAGQSEQRTLANCAHPNIVSFVDRFSDSYNYYLIMEFVDGTDLREEVKRRAARNPPKLFSISSVLFLFVQVLLGTEYMHRHNIIHRDMKTANILISFKWQVKICDLGFAKEYEQDTDGYNNSVGSMGTPYYMSPEILNGEPYGEKVDIWALGIILYEILTLQRPFTHAEAEVIADRILNTEPVPVTEYRKDIPPELVAILKQCLIKDQRKRPSAKEILKTPIFSHAVEDYINKMRNMASSAGSAVDKWWVQVLEDHQRLVSDSFVSAQKSRNSERGERRTAMSTTGTRFLATSIGQM